MNTSAAIVRMNRSFQSVMKAFLTYARALEQQYGDSFTEACIKYIVDYMMLSRYLQKQSRPPYIRYARFRRLTTKNDNTSPLLKSLSESPEDCKKLGMLLLDSEGLHATPVTFVVSQKEVADSYTNSLTASAVHHVPRFFLFSEDLVQTLYDPLIVCSEILKPSFFFHGREAS